MSMETGEIYSRFLKTLHGENTEGISRIAITFGRTWIGGVYSISVCVWWSSVMTGAYTEAALKFNIRTLFWRHFHYAPHRCTTMSAAMGNYYVAKYLDIVLPLFHTYFSKSPKRLPRLRDFLELYDEPYLIILKTISFLWLSRYTYVENMLCALHWMQCIPW